ncbi:C39 family peptidase, partial [Gemella haemolysans]|uniref:C39 family peptidase n=1 Tax=Gemella haemolysans TaxID=1379 RepID=UPI0019594B70
QNGKKLTGYGKDNAGTHYFVNGKYADWWYDDGTDWFFFQNGKKLTGYGKDNDGTHYFVNGKYANGLHNGKYYLNGQVSTNASALNMPQYYQWDKRWGNRRYGASNLTMAGCVPTSLAMVFNGLGQQVLPPAVADTISSGGGLNTNGVGTSAKGAAYAINKHGYNYRVLKTKEQLISALQNGEPVLATVKQGYFVRSAYATHAIVLSGYDNGKVKAMDPYNTNATGKWYNINEIWNQRSDADSDTMLGGSFTAIGK